MVSNCESYRSLLINYLYERYCGIEEFSSANSKYIPSYIISHGMDREIMNFVLFCHIFTNVTKVREKKSKNLICYLLGNDQTLLICIFY